MKLDDNFVSDLTATGENGDELRGGLYLSEEFFRNETPGTPHKLTIYDAIDKHNVAVESEAAVTVNVVWWTKSDVSVK